MGVSIAQLLVLRDQLKNRLEADNTRLQETFSTPMIETEVETANGNTRSEYAVDDVEYAANTEEFHSLYARNERMVAYASFSAAVARANDYMTIELQYTDKEGGPSSVEITLNAAHALMHQLNMRKHAVHSMKRFAEQAKMRHATAVMNVRDVNIELENITSQIAKLQSQIMAENNKELPEEYNELLEMKW